MDMEGKVAIVTGASSGIGRALAALLLAKGAKVAVCARNEDLLQSAFGEEDGDRVLIQSVDVSDEMACKDFVDNVIAKWGGVDVLINNAGMSMRALFEEVDLKVLKQLMGINFWGCVYMTKYALESITARKGSITGISSIAGYRGLPARTGYTASKFAMNGFLETLRTELLYKGVHVLIASPGFTASNIRNTALTADGTAQRETPLKENKLVSAEDCAAAIVKAIEKRKRTLIMTQQGKWTVRLNFLLPKFMDWMVYSHFRKEPDSPLR